jgi:hypothetical protein
MLVNTKQMIIVIQNPKPKIEGGKRKIKYVGKWINNRMSELGNKQTQNSTTIIIVVMVVWDIH